MSSMSSGKVQSLVDSFVKPFVNLGVTLGTKYLAFSLFIFFGLIGGDGSGGSFFNLNKANAETSQANRMQTTNLPTSAPLNLANRWFAKIESTLNASDNASEWNTEWNAERLSFHTYRLKPIVNPEKTIEKLLGDISGDPQTVRILALDAILPTEANVQHVLDSFLEGLNLKADSADANEVNQIGFRASVKAALTRKDVALFSARVFRQDGHGSGREDRHEGGISKVLILIDNETQDLVLFSLNSI